LGFGQGTLANSHPHTVLDYGQGTLAKLIQFVKVMFLVKGRLPFSQKNEDLGFKSRDACQSGSVLEADTLCQGTLAKLIQFVKAIFLVKGRLPIGISFRSRYFVSRDACQADSVGEGDIFGQGTLAIFSEK
jgi:hypothetical protein